MAKESKIPYFQRLCNIKYPWKNKS